MRHLRNQKLARSVAIPAVLVLGLAACDPDTDEPDTDTETEEPADPAEPDEPDEPSDEPDDEAAALPTGAFGPECDRLLETVDADGRTEDDDGIGTDDATDDATEDATEEDGPDDDGVGTEDDNGLDDDGVGTDDENGVGNDDDADGTSPQATDAEAELASLDLMTALRSIPDLQPLADAAQGSATAQDLEDADQVTVFAPLADAFEQTTGGESPDDEGVVEDDGVAEDGDGVEDDALTEDGGATDDETDDGVTDDEGITGEGAGDVPTADVEQILGDHIHADAALDAQMLADEGSVSTVSGSEITVTVDDAANGTDTDVNGLDDNGVDTDDNGLDDDGTDTDENGLDDNGVDDGPRITVELGDTTAQVVCANLMTADGYVHVIDQVLGQDATGTDGGLDDPPAPDETAPEDSLDADDDTGDGLDDDTEDID